MKTFSPDNLILESEGWITYKRSAKVRAIRIDGPFAVLTSQGELRCEDGYLAIDSSGSPYPIPADELRRSYDVLA